MKKNEIITEWKELKFFDQYFAEEKWLKVVFASLLRYDYI